MKQRYQLYGKNREVFLKGLQRYRDRGVAILVDGREADASEWIKILEVQADGSFYMGDYIMDDFSGLAEEKTESEEERAGSNKKRNMDLEPKAMVCEDRGMYETKGSNHEEEKEVRKESDDSEIYHIGVLKEIRFDRIHLGT